MWHPDTSIHQKHVEAITKVATTKDMTERYILALQTVEAFSATSELSDGNFRTFAMAVSQAAQMSDEFLLSNKNEATV